MRQVQIRNSITALEEVRFSLRLLLLCPFCGPELLKHATQIERKMLKIRAKFHLRSQVKYGLNCDDFQETPV